MDANASLIDYLASAIDFTPDWMTPVAEERTRQYLVDAFHDLTVDQITGKRATTSAMLQITPRQVMAKARDSVIADLRYAQEDYDDASIELYRSVAAALLIALQ